MARGKSHDPETKAAVMAALLAGQGVNEVATRYRLDPSVVSRWKSAMPPDQLQQLATKKGEHIEGLVFDYLGANLIALKAQAHVAADETYLRRYPPQQLAVLHGVMADKAIGLLQAIAQATEDGEEAAGEEAGDTAGANGGAE